MSLNHFYCNFFIVVKIDIKHLQVMTSRVSRLSNSVENRQNTVAEPCNIKGCNQSLNINIFSLYNYIVCSCIALSLKMAYVWVTLRYCFIISVCKNDGESWVIEASERSSLQLSSLKYIYFYLIVKSFSTLLMVNLPSNSYLRIGTNNNTENKSSTNG